MEFFSHYKKILLLLCILAFGFTIGFLIVNKKSLTPNSQTTQELEKIASSQSSTDNSIDTDNDGLKDWEEVLWYTDPKNPDTDGDTTPDAEEVRNNRNPTVKSPNDTVDNGYIAVNSSFTTPVAKNNDKTIQKPTEIPKVQPNQASQPQNETTIALKNYGNSLASAIISIKYDQNDQLEMLKNAVSTSSQPQDIAKLSLVSSAYRDIASRIGSIESPTEVYSIHLNMKKSYENIASALKAISEQSTVNQQLFTEYSTQVAAMGNVIYSLMNYYKDTNIVFNTNEAGALFNF